MIKNGDIIELEFTGKLENGSVFDTTDPKIAKENHLNVENVKPVVIKVGKSEVPKGLDKELVGKEIGKEYVVKLKPEDAFGNKNRELIRTLSLSVFKKHNINPYPGLQLNADGYVGVVKSVSGGRVVVDFNHPLADHEVTYEFKVNRVLTDPEEKLDAVMEKFKIKGTFKKENDEYVLTLNMKNLTKEGVDFIKTMIKDFAGIDVKIPFDDKKKEAENEKNKNAEKKE